MIHTPFSIFGGQSPLCCANLNGRVIYFIFSGHVGYPSFGFIDASLVVTYHPPSATRSVLVQYQLCLPLRYSLSCFDKEKKRNNVVAGALALEKKIRKWR